MIPKQYSAMYDLGRQARESGFQTFACNVNDPVGKAWWLAGWHDLDMEKGVQMFHRVKE